MTGDGSEDRGRRGAGEPEAGAVVRSPDVEESDRRRLARYVNTGRVLTTIPSSLSGDFGEHIGRRPPADSPSRLSRRRHFQLGGLLLAAIGALTVFASVSVVPGPLLLLVGLAEVAAGAALVLAGPPARVAALGVGLVGFLVTIVPAGLRYLGFLDPRSVVIGPAVGLPLVVLFYAFLVTVGPLPDD